MTTFSKLIEAFIADTNQDNSKTISIFEGITKFIFVGVVSLAVPLFLYLILQI